MNDLLETNNDLLSLFNKNKISNEVASLSSMSSLSSSSSIKSSSNKNKINIKKKLDNNDNFNNKINMNSFLNNNNKNKIIKKNNDDDDDDDDYEDDNNNRKNKINKNKKKYDDDDDEEEDDDDEEEGEDEEEDGEEDEEEEEDDEDGDIKSNSSGGSNNIVKSKKDIIAEKREILYQLKRLEDKGYKIPNSYNMQSDLLEMKQEYNRIIRDKEIDSSVRFQRKMLMAFVTGTEYLNTRYDPFSIKLEGWSEQVHDNIVDYDDIFEELHEKYKSKGRKMPPELRLFISLSGSAFMFHLTSRMFKESAIPGVEEVLKSNPSLMKEFQNAAAKQYMYKSAGLDNSFINNNQGINNNNYNNQRNNNQGGGLFGMIGNLFGGLTNTPAFNNGPMMQQPIQNKKIDRSSNDINNIINNVHSKISTHLDDDNKIETLSISDEEITSIIEDATDVNLLKKSVKGKNKRTLNI